MKIKLQSIECFYPGESSGDEIYVVVKANGEEKKYPDGFKSHWKFKTRDKENLNLDISPWGNADFVELNFREDDAGLVGKVSSGFGFGGLKTAINKVASTVQKNNVATLELRKNGNEININPVTDCKVLSTSNNVTLIEATGANGKYNITICVEL